MHKGNKDFLMSKTALFFFFSFQKKGEENQIRLTTTTHPFSFGACFVASAGTKDNSKLPILEGKKKNMKVEALSHPSFLLFFPSNLNTHLPLSPKNPNMNIQYSTNL